MNCAALRPKPKCAASNLITKRRNPRDYWVDQRVSVYYGPNRPANAVLEPVAEGLLARGLLTVAFLISGAALLAYMSGVAIFRDFGNQTVAGLIKALQAMGM